jgi:hypothetical protein
MSLLLIGCGDDSSSKITTPDDSDSQALVLGAPSSVHHHGTRVGDNLNWNPPTDTEGRLAGYNVYVYDPDPFTDDIYRRVNTTVVPTNRYFFNDLVAGVDYVVRIRSVDTDGAEGDWSTPHAFRAFGDDGRPPYLGQTFVVEEYGQGDHYQP